MAFTPNFSPSQTIGSPSILNLQDNSTGSDGAITVRHIYLTKSDGTYLVPSGTSTNYIVWAIANPSIALDVLDIDYALNIVVLWLDAGGNTLYTKSGLFCFSLYAEQFYYGLTQALAANYPIIADTNYYQNKGMLRTEIDSADYAVSIGGDSAASQACLNRAAFLIQNQSFNF